jgi:hypothetical protein
VSTYHYAHLGYGYDLGCTEKYEIAEVDEYGGLNFPWVKRDDEGWADERLNEAIIRKLYEAIPGADPGRTEIYQQDDIVEGYYGVTVLEHGWVTEGDTPSFALIAHEEQCDGGDVKALELDKLQELIPILKPRLDRALEILEITLNQEQPSWLLMASR